MLSGSCLQMITSSCIAQVEASMARLRDSGMSSLGQSCRWNGDAVFCEKRFPRHTGQELCRAIKINEVAYLKLHERTGIRIASVSQRGRINSMRKAILLFIIMTLPSILSAETFYHWMDEEGVYNFTNDYEKVPFAFRDKAERKVLPDVSESRSPTVPSSQPAPKDGEDKNEDIVGSQRTWREGEESVGDRTLEQISESYEAAKKRYLDRSDELILRRYGSHQQFKSTILELTPLREEKNRYEAKLMEAKEMLKRTSGGTDSDGLAFRLRAPRPDSPNPVEAETDLLGRNRAWWISNISLQRQQLDTAIQNYEKAYKIYTDDIDKLDPSRFGGLSLTQYQMISTRLGVLKAEIEKYAKQVDEAAAGLNELMKEAEKSRANPEWLK
jgi:hypothetical protein